MAGMLGFVNLVFEGPIRFMTPIESHLSEEMDLSLCLASFREWDAHTLIFLKLNWLVPYS